MVDVVSKRCAHGGCTKVPSYGKVGGNAEYCSEHADDGMVDVRSKRCAHADCTTRPSCGKAGGKAEYCRDHAEDAMVNVNRKRCAHGSSSTSARFSVEGGARIFCARHDEEGFVSLDAPRNKSDGDRAGRRRRGRSGAMGNGTARCLGSDGRRTPRRVPAVSPTEASAGSSKDTNKRSRRRAFGGNLRPVRVKREEEQIDRMAGDEDSRASSESPTTAAVVKTEDMEVSCKAEPTEPERGGGSVLVDISTTGRR